METCVFSFPGDLAAINQKFFVYKDLRLPIDFDLLVKHSNFFFNHKNEYQGKVDILLIDKDENIISLNSNVISKFIKACQNQPFDLYSSELQAFYYLSLKFEVINLINYIRSQLSSNNPQFLLQLLSLKLKCKDFYEKEEQVNEEMKTFYTLDTCEEEEIISKAFERLTSDDNLIQLPLPILYRIFEGYLRQRRDKNPIDGKTKLKTKLKEGENEELQFTKSEENNIEVFLFKCLDYHGRSASTLFSFINFEHIRSEVIERLITQYRNTFDFAYINGTLMKTISDLTSQQVLLIEVNKHQQQQISQLIEENSSYKNKFHELIQQFEQFKKDIEQKHSQEIKELQQSNQTEINKLIESNKKVVSNHKKVVDDLKKQFDLRLNDMQTKHSQEISNLKQSIQNNTDNIKNFNDRNQTEFGSIKSVQKQLSDLSKSTQSKIKSIQNDIDSKLANKNEIQELKQQFERRFTETEQNHSEQIHALQQSTRTNIETVTTLCNNNKSEIDKSRRNFDTKFTNLSNDQKKKISQIQTDVANTFQRIQTDIDDVTVAIPNTFAVPQLRLEDSDGICTFLLFNNGDSTNANKTIKVTAFPDDNNDQSTLDQIVTSDNSKAWCSKNNPNAYIQFDFGTNSIAFTALKIWTGKDTVNGRHIKSFIIYGSNDGNEWECIGSWTASRLNGSNNSSNCLLNNETVLFYCYLKLQLNGPNYKGTNELYLKRIEFFGNVKREVESH